MFESIKEFLVEELHVNADDVTPEAELIAFASKALRVYFAGMLLFGIQIACQMTFVSLGNAPSSILVAVTRKFFLLLLQPKTVEHSQAQKDLK